MLISTTEMTSSSKQPPKAGGATVVWRTDLYQEEAIRQLSDPTFYNKVNKDVTSANQKIVKDTIQELITKQERPVTAQNLITAITTPRISYIYFKPNIHKPKYPGRPIVSACSCLSELISLTNRFHVAVRLFSNRSQMTSKCGKNEKMALEAHPSVSLMFLPHFDGLCHLLLNRRTATGMESICFM